MLFRRMKSLFFAWAIVCLTSCCLVPCVNAAAERSAGVSNYQDEGTSSDQNEQFTRDKRHWAAASEMQPTADVASSEDQPAKTSEINNQQQQQQTIPAANPSFEAAFQGECGQIESNQSNFTSSNRNPCEHICQDLHDGTYECSCFYGFALAVDGYSCTRLAAELTSSAATVTVARRDNPKRDGELKRKNNNQPERQQKSSGGRRSWPIPDPTREAPASTNLPGANGAESPESVASLLVGGGGTTTTTSNDDDHQKQTNFSSLFESSGAKNDWPTEQDDDNKNRNPTGRTMAWFGRQDRDKKWRAKEQHSDRSGERRTEPRQLANGMQVERKLANSAEAAENNNNNIDENNLALGEEEEDGEDDDDEQDDDDDGGDIRVEANEISSNELAISNNDDDGDSRAGRERTNSTAPALRRPVNAARSWRVGQLQTKGAQQQQDEETPRTTSKLNQTTATENNSSSRRRTDSNQQQQQRRRRPEFQSSEEISSKGDTGQQQQMEATGTNNRATASGGDTRTITELPVEYKLDLDDQEDETGWNLVPAAGGHPRTAVDKNNNAAAADAPSYRLATDTLTADDPDRGQTTAAGSARSVGAVWDDQNDQADRGADSKIKSIMLANDELLGQFEIELNGGGRQLGPAADEGESGEESSVLLSDSNNNADDRQQKDKAKVGLSAKLMGKSKRSSEIGEKFSRTEANGKEKKMKRKVDEPRKRFHQQLLDYDLNLLGNLVDETILDYHNQRSAGELFGPRDELPEEKKELEMANGEDVDEEDDGDEDDEGQDNDKFGLNEASSSAGRHANPSASGPTRGSALAVEVTAVDGQRQQLQSNGFNANAEGDRRRVKIENEDNDDADRTENRDKMVVTNRIWPSNEDETSDDDEQTNPVERQQQNELIISYENCFEMPDCEAGGECVVERSAGSARQQARCRCPLGRGGYLCQKSIQRSIPRFSSQSYLSLPLRAAIGGRVSSLKIVFKPEHRDSSALESQHNNHIQSSSLLLYTNNFAILLDSMNRIEFRYLNSNNFVDDDEDGGEQQLHEDEEEEESNEMGDKYFASDSGGEVIPATLTNEIGEVTRVIGSRDVQMDKWNELIVTDASSDDYFKFNQGNKTRLGASSGRQAVNRIVVVTPDKINSISSGRGRGSNLIDQKQLLFVGGLPDLINTSRSYAEDNNDNKSDYPTGNRIAGRGVRQLKNVTQGPENHKDLILGDQLKDITNFAGCVRELTLNDKSYTLKSSPDGDALDGFDIDECRVQ